jgi:hypothetical protein
MKLSWLCTASIAAGLALVAASEASAAPLVAEYAFNNTLNSTDGAPALTATDPLGTSGFVSDNVFGNTRTVYHFTGSTTPSQQGGLTLNTTGLLSSDSSWSAEIDFEFFDRTNAWRRILDVQNRASDNGFYVDPGNHLDIYPVAGTADTFNTDTYYKVFISVSGGTVSTWLGTSSQFTTTTNVMDINNPQNLINLFLDNTVGGGQGEWSSGNIAYFGLYNGALTDSDVATLSGRALPTGTPLPGSLVLLASGLAALAGIRRRN